MYGVFRTAAAKLAFPRNDHHAFDWTFSAATLLHGTHVQIPKELMYREITPSHKYVQYVRRDAATAIDKVFPLRGLTVALLFEKRVPISIGLLRSLAAANLQAHSAYMREFHPRYWRAFGWTLERILWRL